jgi:electron transfer flavoprotein beta subunit
MKIAVCLKQVPTRLWQPRIDHTQQWVLDDDATFELNEADGHALEEGLRLRDEHGGELVVVLAGPVRALSVVRDALGRGADRAIHVEDDRRIVDGVAVAHVLAGALSEEAFDLVLTGLQSADIGAGVVGVALAELMGLPHVSLATECQLDGPNSIRVKRELEGGWSQWVGMPLPALVTVQSGRHALRFATLKGVMAAKKKEIRRVSPAPVAPLVEIVSLAVPARRKATQFIEGTPREAATTLLTRLRKEARVL